MIPAAAQSILDFWFGVPSEPTFDSPRKVWFIKSQSFDDEIRDRFSERYQQAITGELDTWQQDPESCLALLIVLDQFSRNLFRGSPHAFQADPKALAIAKHSIHQGYDQRLNPVQRWFIYLPFEHSENREDQQRSVELWETLRFHPPSASSIDYAYRHANVIQQFGRFPHRNAILDRPSTDAELDFLSQPGSSF